MIVYIDGTAIPLFDENVPETEGRIPCELTVVRENGCDLRADTWSMSGYGGAVYDEDGNALTPAALELALLREDAHALMAKLRDAGELDELLSHARLLDRLLDGLESVPLLSAIIKRIREG